MLHFKNKYFFLQLYGNSTFKFKMVFFVCVCDDLYGVGFVFIRVILQIVPEQFA